ncbi:UrcA family protein [Sphingomonas sp. BIUV-7]|uniref:UrcA family protein n=1 Tax=Sphingomonas natans TaxID=3063330 RepID=A0ABT8YEY3_9SPHN|nr:UrcA family protein [Sphingomonas sp. BIUV-7]MDO6416338.1 UrcA family protein [Sphingomonas sp. BIUV-7]
MLDLLAFAALAASSRLTLTDVRQLSRPVPYADLDLSTALDRETLQRRVRDTANLICRDLAFGQALPSGEEYHCRSEAMASARPQVTRVLADYRGGPETEDVILLAQK